MDKTNKKMDTKTLTMLALLAALSYVVFTFGQIRITLPGGDATSIHLGNAVCVLGALLLGGMYGALAGGIGSAMADLLSGYTHYVPATFLIKFLMALAAWFLFSRLADKVNRTVSLLISAAAAELIMMTGYFLYQSTILGYGLAAFSSVPGNITQGITCSVLAIVCIHALYAAKVPQHFFAGQH